MAPHPTAANGHKRSFRSRFRAHGQEHQNERNKDDCGREGADLPQSPFDSFSTIWAIVRRAANHVAAVFAFNQSSHGVSHVPQIGFRTRLSILPLLALGDFRRTFCKELERRLTSGKRIRHRGSSNVI